MSRDGSEPGSAKIRRRAALQSIGRLTAGAGLIGLGVIALTSSAPVFVSPAVSQPAPALPTPPANGEMGFVVQEFIPPVIQGKDACPDGNALRLRDAYLETLPADERARLKLKENLKEWDARWFAYAFGPHGTNICSQPDQFKRPLMRTVQSKYAWGLDLGGHDGVDTCPHDKFTDPDGRIGVDNQEYRAMGCTPEWRGVDGVAGDIATGMRQFHGSGEWTQVILLRGVHSLVHQDNVEVIYANTPDRPPADSKGHFLTGASFSVSDTAPRHRNVLHGRIENGVLTTDPTDIVLTETWGQGGARDIRGNRTNYDYRQGRLRLVFQPDGGLHGFLGGYRPVFDVVVSEALGGIGSALVAGIDCAQSLTTLRHYADGLRDPKTGQCNGVSSAMQIKAIPAFVNDIAPKAPLQRISQR